MARRGDDSIMMLALKEALQDPFQQGNQNLMDSKHLGEINPEAGSRAEWNRAAKKLSLGSLLTWAISANAANARAAQQQQQQQLAAKNGKKAAEVVDDPDKVFRTYPGFDPVFMKI